MAAKKKITRKELKEDHFMDGVNTSVEYIKAHSKQAMLIVGGVIVVGLLVWLYIYYQNSQEEAASEAFGNANIAFNRNQFQSATKAFEEVITRYGGTSSGAKSTYFLAYTFYQMNQYDSSAHYFQHYLDKYSDPDLTYGAKSGLAACAEQTGDFTKAAELYWKLVKDEPDHFSTPRTIMAAARCYRNAGNAQGAKDAYQLLIDKYSDSNFVSEAKRRLAELG